MGRFELPTPCSQSYWDRTCRTPGHAGDRSLAVLPPVGGARLWRALAPSTRTVRARWVVVGVPASGIFGEASRPDVDGVDDEAAIVLQLDEHAERSNRLTGLDH